MKIRLYFSAAPHLAQSCVERRLEIRNTRWRMCRERMSRENNLKPLTPPSFPRLLVLDLELLQYQDEIGLPTANS
jgi:hypothetical protein